MSKTKEKLRFQNAKRKLSELIPTEWNPRRLTEKQAEDLKKSLEKFDLAEVPVINLDGTIIAGHQRTKILHQLYGDIEIDVRIPSRQMSEAEVKEYNVRSNKNTGEWDFDLLANNFELEDLIDWGFSENELAFLEPEIVEPEGDEDAIPEAPKEPVTVLGDLYEIGPHRLLCGDSTVITDVDKLMGGKKADMVFTDPPYGISIVSGSKIGGDKPFGSKKKRGTDGSSNIVKANNYAPIAGDDSIDIAIEAIQIIHALDPKVQIIWGGNYYANHLPNSSCWLVWDKKNSGNFADCELAWTNQKTAVRLFSHMWNGMIKESEHGQKRVHPTQKPVALAEWVFLEYGKEGDAVIDLFLGSGSTMVAAHKTNRICYGMELSPQYCDVIVKRMHKAYPTLEIKRNGEEIDLSNYE
jgi:DNA modification methylase